MFRKSTLVLGALALLLVAPQAHAAKGDVSATIGGGAEVPVSQTGSSVGFMGGGDVDYMVTEMVAVGVDASFFRQRSKVGSVTVSSNLESGGGHVKYMFPMAGESKLSPYVVGGAGIYHSTSNSKVGGRGGLGGNYKANDKLNINVEATINIIKQTVGTTKFAGVRVGVNFPLGGSK